MGRSRLGPTRHEDLRLGDGFAVDLGDAREAPEVPAVIHELGAQHELIARPDDLLKPRFLDAHEIENRNSFVGGSSFIRFGSTGD